MSNYQQMMQFVNMLYCLEWTDNEILNLPETYTNMPIHLALEHADKEYDNINFYKILQGNGRYRELMLLKHIQKTMPVFVWNYNLGKET